MVMICDWEDSRGPGRKEWSTAYRLGHDLMTCQILPYLIQAFGPNLILILRQSALRSGSKWPESLDQVS